MKLENQVVSLELAKKLKALGVEQKSIFYHVKNRYRVGKNERNKKRQRIILLPPSPKFSMPKDFYSAFTVAELIELLPDYIEQNGIRSFFKMDRAKIYPGIEYGVGYNNDAPGALNCGFCVDDNPAEAVGQMLAYLLKNQLITV